MPRRLQRLLVAICVLTAGFPPADASTRKGDGLIARARMAEAKDTTADLDEALKLAQQALETDRNDIGYQLESARLRAFAAQYHVYEGQVLRGKGKIDAALLEFVKAAELDPASEIAPQEVARTREIIKRKAENPNANFEDLLLRPLPLKNKQDEKLFSTAAPVPKLKLEQSPSLPAIKVNNQPSNEVYAALAKQANLRVLFDPEFQPRSLGLNQVLDFGGLNIEEAFDYLALVTKSFWKPLSAQTIFVSNDDPARRASYEDQVTKTFYLTNAPITQEVNNIAQTVQKITDIRKLFVHPELNVIVARADPDRLALAEKVIADLDKPKAEIIVDVIILSVTKNWSRDLGIALGLDGSNLNAVFAPGPALNPANVAGRIGVPLDLLQKITAGDYNVTLPSAAVDALLTTRGTKVLDKAQLRTVEGQKSTLRIGQKVPYATGSFSPGSAGGISAIVNTQFQFFDVGLNIDVIAKVHEPDEVSLHIESDTSSVADRVDLGGVLQPVISQRRRVADVRVKEGEVNFWDIVTERQDLRNTSGVPGLSQIPIVGRVFTREHLEKSELQVLTLLVPHIIRAPDIRDVNLMGLPSGSDQVVRLRYNSAQGPVSERQLEVRMVELPPGNAPANVLAMSGGGMQGMPGMGMPGGAPMAPPSMEMGSPTGMPMAPPMGMTMAQPTSAVRAGFTPTRVTSPVNGNFAAELTFAAPGDIREGTIVVQFDPKALKLIRVAPGSVAAPDGIQPATGAKIEDGTVVVKLMPMAPGMPVNGGVATFYFQLLTPGATRITVPAVQLVNAQSQAVNAASEGLEVVSQ